MDLNNIKFELKEGSRAGSLLLYTPEDQQIYIKNKVLKEGETLYGCRVTKCKARVYLSADQTQVFSKPEKIIHKTHGPQGRVMEKISVLSEIKNKCLSNKLDDTKALFDESIAEKSMIDADIDINYDSIKRTLQRIRQKSRGAVRQRSKRNLGNTAKRRLSDDDNCKSALTEACQEDEDSQKESTEDQQLPTKKYHIMNLKRNLQDDKFTFKTEIKETSEEDEDSEEESTKDKQLPIDKVRTVDLKRKLLEDNNTFKSEITEACEEDEDSQESSTEEQLPSEKFHKMDLNNIKFEIKEGSRVGSQILYTTEDKHMYIKNKLLRQGATVYVCRVQHCKAKVYLSVDQSRVYSQAQIMEHSHGPQGQEMDRITALAELKHKCQSSESGNPKIMFYEMLVDKSMDDLVIDVDFHSIKRTLQRKRQECRAIRNKQAKSKKPKKVVKSSVEEITFTLKTEEIEISPDFATSDDSPRTNKKQKIVYSIRQTSD